MNTNIQWWRVVLQRCNITDPVLKEFGVIPPIYNKSIINRLNKSTDNSKDIIIVTNKVGTARAKDIAILNADQDL